MEIFKYLQQFKESKIEKYEFIEYLEQFLNSVYMNYKKFSSEKPSDEIFYCNKCFQSLDAKVLAIIVDSLSKNQFLENIYKQLEEIKKTSINKQLEKLPKIQSSILKTIDSYYQNFNYLYNHFLFRQSLSIINSLNLEDLTDKEKRVLSLIFLDFDTKDISKILNISPKSVDSFKYRLKRKLGLQKNEKIQTVFQKNPPSQDN